MIPLIRFSKDTQLILLLIREELKINKLFQGLEQAGFEDCPLRPYLDGAILTCAGFDSYPDDLTQFILELFDTYAAGITKNTDLDELALQVYSALITEKNRRLKL